MKSDGEGSVEFAGEKGMGGSIDEALNGVDERPAEDRGHGDVVAEGNAEVDWVAVREGKGKDISDNCAKEPGFKGS